MAKEQKKQDDSGRLVGRLTGKGEDTVSKLLNDLANNPRVTDAIGRALSAKGKVDANARKALSQAGLAAADELKDLRKQIERLERRLARLEGGSAEKSTTKKTPTAKKRTTTAKPAANKPASPPPSGRSASGG